MEIIFWIVVMTGMLIGIYGIIPTVFLRTFTIGMIKKGEQVNALALTFDDGPNPSYTPKVLDLLQKYEMKATFFVVAEKANKYPDLIRRMEREGHSIGIHHYHHTDSWFLTPWRTKREITGSAEAIEKLTGVRPNFYRPPYGRFNVFTNWFARRYQIVLWSSIFHDWKKRSDASGLRERLIGNISDGQIFLLHDDGEDPGADDDAPEQMIEALKGFLPELRQRGFRSVSLDVLLNHNTSEGQKWSV